MTSYPKSYIAVACPQCGKERIVNDRNAAAARRTRCMRCYADSMRCPPEYHAARAREKMNRYYWADPEKYRVRARLDFALNKEARITAQRERRQRDPRKYRAQSAVAQALKRGELMRGQCACGADGIEAHHPDYDKPLEVEWLCPRCHGERHRKG
jgi:hypothetical protein